MGEPLPFESLAELLDRQCGVLSRGQATSYGLSRGAVAARLRSGRWRRVHPRVYATFTGPLPRGAQIWAALLYAGPDALLCGHTAAEIDGLVDRPRSSIIHVAVPAHRQIRAQPGVRIHRSRRHALAGRLKACPPRTCIEETVLDLVTGAATGHEALALVAGACQRRLTTAGRLAAACAVRRNLRWRCVILPALRDVADGAHSLLELRYLRDVERRHGLPRGQRQRPMHRGRRREWTDVGYGDHATVVELDGRLGHDEVGAAWRDMRRDNAAVVAGEAPLRYGWADVMGRPCTVAAQVGAVLRSRGWSGQPRRCGNSCTL